MSGRFAIPCVRLKQKSGRPADGQQIALVCHVEGFSDHRAMQPALDRERAVAMAMLPALRLKAARLQMSAENNKHISTLKRAARAVHTPLSLGSQTIDYK